MTDYVTKRTTDYLMGNFAPSARAVRYVHDWVVGYTYGHMRRRVALAPSLIRTGAQAPTLSGTMKAIYVVAFKTSIHKRNHRPNGALPACVRQGNSGVSSWFLALSAKLRYTW